MYIALMNVAWSLCLSTLLLVAAFPRAEAQTTIIRAKALVDVSAGKLVQPAVVIVKDDRIQSVNPPSVPEGQQVDLRDLILVPGLTDMHTHLTMDVDKDFFDRPVKETAADAALRGARNARKTLLAGFTTVRDVGARDFVDIALMHAIDKGLIDGPQMFAAGHPITITGGHADAGGFAPGIAERGPEGGVADGVDEVLKAVRYQIKHGAKVVKLMATAGVLSFEATVGAQQLSEAEMRAAVEEAARHGLKVAAHAHGKDGILAAIRAGVASIEHGSEIGPEAIALMKERGTYLVPTTYLADALDLTKLPAQQRAKAEKELPLAKQNLREAIRAGVKIAFGTDAAVYPHGQNAKEFASLVDRGMKPADALRAATVNAADLLGVTDRGRIAGGLRADLIAVAGNPLEDVRVLEDPRFVMKAGQIYKRP